VSAVTQRSRILLDEEYYTYTQPPPQQDEASQLGATQPQQPQQSRPPSVQEYIASTEHLYESQAPRVFLGEEYNARAQPQQPSRPPSVQEYIAKTEHLYESQAPSPVSEYSIVKTGAGNVYVYTPSAGWQKLEYKPDSNAYSLVPVSSQDITAEVAKLGGTGYKVEPQLAEKLAREEPHALMWGGVEEALRYARLRETFPELAKEKWITEADVQNVITQRLEGYGWRSTTREEYEALRALAKVVAQNPDAWKAVEEGIQKQLEEAQRKQEELQRFYTAKALKQWDAERLEEARRQYEQFYRSASEATPAWAVPLQSFINNMARFLSFGLVNPQPSGYEALLARYEQLASKAPAPGMMLPRQRIKEGLEAGVYTPLEQKEIQAIEKSLDPGKTLLYTAGYAAAFFAAGKVLEGAARAVPKAAEFLRWEFSEGLAGRALRGVGIEPRLPDSVARFLESAKAKALGVGERAGLVERVQLVPREVESVVARVEEGRETLLVARTKITEWGRAEELLGKKVPEGMRLRPGEVSLLPLEGGFKVPVVGEGEVAAARLEGLRFTWEKGWEPARKELLFARGAGEESLIAARLASERFEMPRLDVAAVRARVDYAKILEQAMGGLPRVAITEEGEVLAGVSRTPRIPVKEVFRPVAERLPPLLLPPKLPVKEDVRAPQVNTPLRLPVVEGLRSSVDLAPPRAQPAAPRLLPMPPVLGDIAAMIPGAARAPVPAEPVAPRQTTRLEPRLELPQLPKLAPKVELPQLAAPASPPPQPPQRALPKLPAPPLPVFGGVRDVPVPRPPRLFGSREWLVRWFGPGAPEVIPAARSRRGGRRRGGRR